MLPALAESARDGLPKQVGQSVIESILPGKAHLNRDHFLLNRAEN